MKDVITKQEPKVFERVTGLTVKIFEKMCELGVFHNVNMDHSIFSFRKFEDSSLNYVGGTKYIPKTDIQLQTFEEWEIVDII